MTREMIINELQNKGFNASKQDTVKNGVTFKGIKIETEKRIIPVIYTDQIIEEAINDGKTFEDVVSEIIEIYESCKDVSLNIADFSDKKIMLSHLFIGLQKASSEELVKRNYELDEIESYIYIRGGKDEERYSIKVNEMLLKECNISIDEAWDYAEKNTYEETEITNMAKIISRITGVEFPEDIPMYIVSNKNRDRGASCILNKKIQKEVGKMLNTDKIVALPSSIHEVIVVPYESSEDLDMLSEMVKDVNSEEVTPSEQLSNKAYTINI